MADPGPEDGRQLTKLGSQLPAGQMPRGRLVKLLKALGEVLERLPQSTDGLESPLAECAKGLTRSAVLQHSDREVEARASFCLIHTLRVHAPDSPFEDNVLQDIFALFIRVLEHLKDPSWSFYCVCRSVLEQMALVRCYLLLLDFEEPDLAKKMFAALLSSINDNNYEDLEGWILEMLLAMLDEGGDLLPVFVGLMLDSLLHLNDGMAFSCRHGLVLALLRKSADHTWQALEQLLVHPQPSQNSKQEARLHADRHKVIMEMYRLKPERFPSFLLCLSDALNDPNGSERLQMVELFGKLLLHPEGMLAIHNCETSKTSFVSFFERFVDAKMEVRLKMLDFVPDFLHSPCLEMLHDQVLNGASERLLDIDEKVRGRAVHALTVSAASNLASVPNLVLQNLCLRLRDKKFSVRRAAAQGITDLVRSIFNGNGECPSTSAVSSQVMKYLGHLLSAGSTDPELKHCLLTHVWADGLLSTSMAPTDGAKFWVMLYQNLDEGEKAGLLRILSVRSKLQVAINNLLRARRPDRQCLAHSDEDVKVDLKGVHRSIASCCLDRSGAMECLTSLMQVKDLHVFSLLDSYFGAAPVHKERSEIRKELVSRVGSKSALGSFLHMLTSIGSPMPPEQGDAIVTGECGDAEATREFLAKASKEAPSLFVGSLIQIAKAVKEGSESTAAHMVVLLSHLSTKMVHCLGSASRELLHSLVPALQRMCSKLPPKAAKAALMALSAVAESSERTEVLRAVYTNLVEALEAPEAEGSTSLPSVLQALGALGRVAPDIFKERVHDIAEFVLQDYMLCDSYASPLSTPESDSQGQYSSCIVLKGQALKALGAGCVPDRGSKTASAAVLDAAKRTIKFCEGLLHPNEDMTHLGVQHEGDAGHLRLAAASTLLRLARRFNSNILPSTYVALSLMIQDPLMDVRQAFCMKIRRHLQVLQAQKLSGQRCAKFAACLPLAALDPAESNRIAANRTLREFVSRRRSTAETLEGCAIVAASGGSSTIHEHPEFTIPYLIYLLAHHPDFPGGDAVDEMGCEVYDPFQEMLAFGLLPLLVDRTTKRTSGTYPAICKLLRTIKRASDATEPDKSENIRILCDIGLSLASKIMEMALHGKELREQRYPASVSLPRALYKTVDVHREGNKHEDGSHLPKDLELIDVDFRLSNAELETHPGKENVGKATNKRRRCREDSEEEREQPTPQEREPRRKRGRKRGAA